MLNPIVHMYAAVAARTAAVTPPASPHGSPSPNPLRPHHGFHFRRPGSGGGYGADGMDTSTLLLIVIGGGAIVVALAAWLFLLWRQRRSTA